jgi:hypothetical protein
MMKLTRKNALLGSLVLAICLAQGAMAEDPTIVAECHFSTESQFTESKLYIRIEKAGNEYAGVFMQTTYITGDPGNLQDVPVSVDQVTRSSRGSATQYKASKGFDLSINLGEKTSSGTYTGTFTYLPGTESNLPQTPEPVTCTGPGA